MNENQIFIKKTLEECDLSDIKTKVVPSLEFFLNCKFPEYVPGTSKAKYIEILTRVIIARSDHAIEAGEVLSLTQRAFYLYEKIAPVRLPWYLRLFKTNNN